VKINATFLYAGMADYWGGDGRRWDDNAGCLFAYYGRDTTLRELVDDWVEDFIAGGDCDSFPEDVTSEDIRAAILEMLSEQGRQDYESGAISEFAQEFADANPDEDEDDGGESPVAIILVELEND
jgi:hypothetical protein